MALKPKENTVQIVGWRDSPSLQNSIDEIIRETGATKTAVKSDLIQRGIKDYKAEKNKPSKAVAVKKQSTKFTPPDKNEVLAYFLEKGSDKEEAKSFWYFYDSKNWMVGKTKMSKWRSSASNWINKNKKGVSDNSSLTDLMHDDEVLI